MSSTSIGGGTLPLRIRLLTGRFGSAKQGMFRSIR